MSKQPRIVRFPAREEGREDVTILTGVNLGKLSGILLAQVVSFSYLVFIALLIMWIVYASSVCGIVLGVFQKGAGSAS